MMAYPQSVVTKPSLASAPIVPSPDILSKFGSFRDCLRSPIHRWFAYPAGYSHRLVEYVMQEYELNSKHWVLDPFVGTGTTSLAAQHKGVNSIGIEAHPFVYWVAKTKLYRDYNYQLLNDDAIDIQEYAAAIYAEGIDCDGVWPELVYKCFTNDNLKQLFSLRTAILQHDMPAERADFFKLALTATLRDATSAGAGWPYIAPSKYAERTVQRPALTEFKKRCYLMMQDILDFGLYKNNRNYTKLIHGDARDIDKYTDSNSIDMALTSPPYLNNYDYADRTRLETYFWGMYETWKDITREVRDHLIVAATTQIRRNELESVRECPLICEISPQLHREITDKIYRLEKIRTVKKGKKSYDLMVAGYFEDMTKVILGVYQALKPGQPFILVLGDSAPYGIHIPTDTLVGDIAVAAGFSSYDTMIIRTRGDKWSGNNQRHKVPLRESIVTITK